jgi:[protein-PII] uridylyltransferase
MVESELGTAPLPQTGPLPAPGRGRVSRRVEELSDRAARRPCAPTKKRQRWLLDISPATASDCSTRVARVLARHKINLQLAKIATLGERVDDTFLIQGAELQHNRTQIAIETELLEALA